MAVRVLDEPAFVLHSIPYKETSLILDVFTRSYGRMALIAKGAKRPHSVLRPVLQRFQPLAISWSGKSELKTMTKAEWLGGVPPLIGDALLCGFYLNELLVKFIAREDPHESLYDAYAQTIALLGQDPTDLEPILRPFELTLFKETGFAAALDYCADTQGAPEQGQQYVYQPERGIRVWHPDDPAHWPIMDGEHLLAMAQNDYADPKTLSQSKSLIRFLLACHLPDHDMMTRQILIDLKKI